MTGMRGFAIKKSIFLKKILIIPKEKMWIYEHDMNGETIYS